MGGHNRADKGWTTSAQDRHDAMYYDEAAVEDALLKLSMADTLNTFEKSAAHEGSSRPDDASKSGHEPHFSSSSDSGSTPFEHDDSFSVIYEESHSPTPSYSVDRLAMNAQTWKCPECHFFNNYVSEHCVSCYHPTPKDVIEAQTNSNSWRG